MRDLTGCETLILNFFLTSTNPRSIHLNPITNPNFPLPFCITTSAFSGTCVKSDDVVFFFPIFEASIILRSILKLSFNLGLTSSGENLIFYVIENLYHEAMSVLDKGTL